jgi:hypothetical protein
MEPTLRADRIAGTLFFVPAVLVGAIWYIYLFSSSPPNRPLLDSALGQLRYTFAPEQSERWWFAWLLALPVFCVALGLAYLFRGAESKRGAIAMFVLSLALAVASFALSDWGLAIFVALPSIWGFRCVRGA